MPNMFPQFSLPFELFSSPLAQAVYPRASGVSSIQQNLLSALRTNPSHASQAVIVFCFLTKLKIKLLSAADLIITKAEEGLPISDFRLLTSDFRLPTSDFRLPTSDFGFLTSDFGLQTSDFRLPTSDFRLPTSDFRLPTSDFRLPTSDF